MPRRKLICYMCKTPFQTDITDEEALKELHDMEGGFSYSQEDCEIICDTCWNLFKDDLTSWLKEDHSDEALPS